MILVLFLALVAVVCLLWLLVNCAVYALPLGFGAVSGLFAHNAGAGWLGPPLSGRSLRHWR